MLILAVDTSCDDTSASVVSRDRILSNVVSSQIRYHQEWGGVVPSLAKRLHTEMIDRVLSISLRRAKVALEDIDYFAVTRGPGLAIALEVGIKVMKNLALENGKPVVCVNHLEGHIYSAFAKNANGKPEVSFDFPMLALLISGGHTELILFKDHGKYEILGRTLDDAVGECFDKVGRILNLGYPGGPVIEKIARLGDENKFQFTVPMAKSKDLNFSYSGLKTQVINFISQINTLNGGVLDSKTVSDIAASFQKTAVDELIIKTQKALNYLEKKGCKIKKLIVVGGVAKNLYLRKRFRKIFSSNNVELLFPTSSKLYTDNAGMIGIAAFYNILHDRNVYFKESILSVDRNPNDSLD